MANSIKTQAHDHKLNYVNTVELYAEKGVAGWHCDACSRNSKELRESHSYNCIKCHFDLCKECPGEVTSNKHEHPLCITLTSNVYKNGQWICDSCGTNGATEGKLSWHCKSGCSFDLCYGCTKDHNSSAHPHLLKKINPKTIYPKVPGWACDICGGKYNHDDDMKPYNCQKCHFDLCKSCLKGTIKEDVEVIQKKMEKSLTLTDGRSTKRTNTPAMVFISYQWNNQNSVLELKKKLEANSISCWMDTGNLSGGDDLKKEIDKGIRGCKLLISCVTSAYAKSQACQQEVALADVLKKPILPVLFESISWPPEGPMAMPFAPLLYVGCENGLNSENLKNIVSIAQSKL